MKPGHAKPRGGAVDNFLIRARDRVIRYLGTSPERLSALSASACVCCVSSLPAGGNFPLDVALILTVMTPPVIVQSSQLSIPGARTDWGTISSFSCSLHPDTSIYFAMRLIRSPPRGRTQSASDQLTYSYKGRGPDTCMFTFTHWCRCRLRCECRKGVRPRGS